MIWCCWHLAASFLFTVNTSHRPWSVLLLVVSILLYAAIMHMAQSFHVNKNVSFSARNVRMNPAVLRGYCAELKGMWWGGPRQGVGVEGRGGFWGHLVGLTDSGQCTESRCEHSLLQPGAEKRPPSFCLLCWQNAVQRDALWVLLETFLHANFCFCLYWFFFFSLVIQEFGDVFSKGFMRESSKGTTARRKS